MHANGQYRKPEGISNQAGGAVTPAHRPARWAKRRRNMIEALFVATGKTLFLLLFLGAVALLTKVISSMLPSKYRDGKIAPEITASVEPDYIADLNKEMKEAGVDNLHDLEEYRERRDRGKGDA